MSDQPNKGFFKNKRFFGFLMVLLVLALGIGIGTLITYHVGASSADSQLQMQTDGKPVAGGALLAVSQAFEEVSSRVGPAVVNINTEEMVSAKSLGAPNMEDEDNPMGQLRRLFGGPLQQMPDQLVHSLGSGVLVDPKGYIITNNHVVEGATRIKVSLDGGKEFIARLIGTDPISDIAVIKINGSKDFPYVRIGNSKSMKVGDWVIAIGSPFGLEQTVTAGIISTTGRTFPNGGGPSENSALNEYLQTDAAINRGNSGGPLVNMNGEVVGINSFISTPSGGSAGVGFAVPSHLFVKVYNQILDGGKVSRGWAGVSMNPTFTPEMASFFGVKQGSGVLVTQLVDEKRAPSESGPAAKAGIKVEDVIIAFDGNKIANSQDFRMAVANAIPGKKVPVKVVRHGQEMNLEMVIGERQLEKQEKSRYSFEEDEVKPKTEIGLEFDNISPRTASALGIPGGAFITSVKPGSLADEAELNGPTPGGGGDVIIAANGKPVNNREDLFAIVKGVKSGSPVILKVMRFVPQDEPATFFASIVKP